MSGSPEPELAAFLHEFGLAQPGDEGIWRALAGGVSSDIWQVVTASGSICVKRALAQLKVAAEWHAPVERNSSEWAYLSLAASIVPGHVPRPLAHDERRGLFAMAWMAPSQYWLWKTELLAGRIKPTDAAAVGVILGKIHAATARNGSIPRRFATDANFHALRIEPYLLATARVHGDLEVQIERVAERTMSTRHVLVHGDVSPKNVLLGPDGPVLIDAECAWYGDPAFDLAFILNHLAIKARVVASAKIQLETSFDALIAAYFSHVDWEDVASLEGRTAALLPILALARVDGKSPLEYLDVAQTAALRAVAREVVARGSAELAVVGRHLMHG